MVNYYALFAKRRFSMLLEEKRKELFRSQKHTLDLFLERGAISRAQYDKSLGDLIVKMGIKEEQEE